MAFFPTFVLAKNNSGTIPALFLREPGVGMNFSAYPWVQSKDE